MAHPSTADMVAMLYERAEYARKQAALAKAAERHGMMVYWRTIEADSDTLRAYVLGNDVRQAVDQVFRHQLEQDIKIVDQEVLDVRVHKAMSTITAA